MKLRGLLLDVDLAEEENSPVIRLIVKEGRRKITVLDPNFSHYFYAIGDNPGELSKLVSKVEDKSGERIVRPKSAKVVRRTLGGSDVNAVKVSLFSPRDMQVIRRAVHGLPDVKSLYEFDIQPHRSYLLDRGLIPMDGLEVEVSEADEGQAVHAVFSPKSFQVQEVPLRVMSFDIEVYNPSGSPRADRDPIIMISLSDNSGFRKVLTWKHFDGYPEYVECLGCEREMIDRFVAIVRERDPDVLLGYNTDMFDFPYLRERARLLKTKLSLGVDGSEVSFRRHRFASAARVRGRIHVDVFSLVDFMATIGSVRLIHYTLEDVYRHFTGKEKPDFEFTELPAAWESGGEPLRRLVDYSMSDADATLELGLMFLPLFVELTRVVGQTLFDVSRMTPGQLVEWLLISEARRRGELVPPRPVGEEFEERLEETYAGAYVMEPVRGLHEDLVVFDFRSLYPSIIVTHNIDPYTLNCKCCGEKERTKVPGLGYWFCRKREGFIPATLRKLIEARSRIKKELKKHGRETKEYRVLNARQTAYKIIANSAYGMLGYSRARWYSKECAESVTSFGRHYIRTTIEMARNSGFKVVYSDTDSLLCKLNGKSRASAVRFMEWANKKLPGIIELEFEGFYPRGVFITKKRYAMVDEEGRMVVKGLEFVRRDWASIAKKTQEEVLKAILKEGSPKKAAEIIKGVTRDLQEGKVALEDLIIYTQLKMPIESYKSIGPHVVAARRLRSLGHQVEPGMMIAYIVVKGPGSISERSYPIEMLQNREPDPEYYISNQVLPAVMRIMEVLGYGEEDLRFTRDKQMGLEKFML